MKLPKNKESGQTLVIALILLALGTSLVVPLLSQVFTNMKSNQLFECKTLNNYAADAGIQYATCRIYNDPTSYLETPLQEVFLVNGRTVNVTAEYQGGGLFSIVSTASGGGCGKTTIKSFVNISHGSFAYSLAAKDYLKISNSIVDSEPNPGSGHIYSNSYIEILGTASFVNGDAFAVGTITKGKDKIAGTITEYGKLVRFPSVYAEIYEEIAQAGGTHNGNLKVESGITTLGPLYITGDLEVKPGATLILNGPLYIVGNVKVEQGHIAGTEHILVEGNINMSGGGYGSRDIPVLIAINGHISLVGPVVDAILYAPKGDVSITNLRLYGAAGGKQVIVSNSEIIYAGSLSGRMDLPGSELYPLTYNYD